MAARQVASHNDYVKLEAHVEAGKSVYEAAKLIGLPVGAFKTQKGDREWYERIVARVETVRAGMVDEKMDAWVNEENASATLRLGWAKANHEAYRDRQEIEINAKVEHEHRGVFAVAELVKLGSELGVLDQLGLVEHRPEGALPAPAEVPARSAGAS